MKTLWHPVGDTIKCGKHWRNRTHYPPLKGALSLLKAVSQRNTIWSVVYDTSSLNFLVVMGKKYDKVHEFNLIQAVSNQ